MSEEPVEQITKVSSELEAQAPKKEKDPKKVVAGKKLAEYNKKMKEAYEREKKAENESSSLIIFRRMVCAKYHCRCYCCRSYSLQPILAI